MTDTRMRFFGNLHPAVSMAYFVLVLGLTLACMHPVTVVLSFLGASWFSIRLRGWRAYGHTMRFVGPMFLLIALANPLFNHRGVTMLFTINHLWYTLEAVCYGLVSGCSLCAVIMWFTCYQAVMTSDKFLYLFGKPFPGTSLLITMTLRFIPQLQQNRREIRQSQAMLQEEGTRLLQRLGSAADHEHGGGGGDGGQHEVPGLWHQAAHHIPPVPFRWPGRSDAGPHSGSGGYLHHRPCLRSRVYGVLSRHDAGAAWQCQLYHVCLLRRADVPARYS